MCVLLVLVLTSVLDGHAQQSTGRLGGGLPIGTVSGGGGEQPGPGPIENMLPAHTATNVSITPTLTYSSAGATTYVIQFGTVSPPVSEQIVLGATASYSPTLAYNTQYVWTACAVNLIATVCSTAQTFTTLVQPSGAPSNITAVSPANGATTVSVLTTLICSATDASSYVVRVGTVNPPVTETSLGADCEHAMSPLAYSTTYYWQILATNTNATTTSAVFSFTTRASPGASSFCARPCTRLLTAAKKTELSARRVANTQKWVEMKANADLVPTADFTDRTTLTSALTTGGAGTTFTIASQAAFPSGTDFKIRIDLEVLTVNCVSLTCTVVSRANQTGSGTTPFAVSAHLNGADVWQHVAIGWEGCNPSGPILAIMEHIGQTGYEQRARACLGQMLASWGPPALINGDRLRNQWWNIARTYDWVRDQLSAHERAVFAPIIQYAATWSINTPKFCYGSPCPTRQGVWEAASIANVGENQIKTGLALAAALQGDSDNAQDDWNHWYTFYTDYFLPALQDGVFYAGNSPEGSEYGSEGLSQAAHMLDVVNAAIGEDAWGAVPGWETRAVKYRLYSMLPGGRDHNNFATTSGTITAVGDTTMTVANAATFDVGEPILIELTGRNGNNAGAVTVDAVIATDILPSGYTPQTSDVGANIQFSPLSPPDGFVQGAFRITTVIGGKWRLNASPAAVGKSTFWWSTPASYNTVIVAKAGNTLTLRDPAPWVALNNTVRHITAAYAYGDDATANNWDDNDTTRSSSIHLASAMLMLFDKLRTTDPTYAGYAKWWIDTAAVLQYYNTLLDEFLYYDATVTAVDYTAAALPTTYSTAASAAASGSTGMLIGMSDWTTHTASWVNFFVGSESGSRGFDHTTNYFNSYGYRRKGVWLTRNLTSYGSLALHQPAPWQTYGDPICAGQNGCFGLGSAAYVGWRTHNTVSMAGMGSSVIFTGEPTGPAILSRSDTQTTHMYGRGNAEGPYRRSGVFGFADTVRVNQRDFLYIKPDLIAVADYLSYSVSGTSLTGWYLQFMGDPSFVGQRATATYSTQKLVHDIILPAASSLAETFHFNEDPFIKGYRVELRSGLTGTTDYGCMVLQGMDAADTPQAVTTLTTTNACVVEVAAGATCASGCVIAFVKGATPTLPIEYTYVAAAPDQYVYGLVPSTAYHITRATKTVTIAAATGTGDTTSSASGRLAVP